MKHFINHRKGRLIIMEIVNRPKGTGRGRAYVKSQKKLPINFDLSSLDLMCTYVLSSNRNIKRGHYVNLRNVMEMLDMSKYANDPDKLNRIMNGQGDEVNG